jgi:maltooligosyltrehalose trehalohydrolase
MGVGLAPFALTLGAISDDAGTSFRVWAPRAGHIVLRLGAEGKGRVIELDREGGYASTRVEGVGAGARYAYVVDGERRPDPCSRSQPDGVHQSSEVVGPMSFAWTDAAFRAPDLADVVIYECHIGTFTDAGTFEAAASQLERLKLLGVNAVELMPVASFGGARNWGYDGVSLFAPHAGYGGPSGLRRLVNAAHGAGLAVILDVVYNHFGPAGNYTAAFSDDYLSDEHKTRWGDAVNFDGRGSAEVRRFVKENLLHWSREYHVDGFRFDAAHAIKDSSAPHILAEVSQLLAREPRRSYLIAESNENDVGYVRPVSDHGYGFDAVWADDFQHIARNILHGDRTTFLASYEGDTRELATAITDGWLYHGQRDLASGERHGTDPRRLEPCRFVFSTQNHDEIGNRPFGLRTSATVSLPDYLTASGLLLLGPQTPLLFQGEEFFAATPFLYFTNHGGEVGRAVSEKRRQEFDFPEDAGAELIPDPEEEQTFLTSKLRWEDSQSGAGQLTERFYSSCLALRAQDPTLQEARRRPGLVTARACGRALLVTISGASGNRYLLANFGDEATFPAPSAHLHTILSSTDLKFGGTGQEPVCEGGSLTAPAHGFALLEAI